MAETKQPTVDELEKKEEELFRTGPLSVLTTSVKSNSQVLINCRWDCVLLFRATWCMPSAALPRRCRRAMLQCLLCRLLGRHLHHVAETMMSWCHWGVLVSLGSANLTTVMSMTPAVMRVTETIESCWLV